MVTASDTGIGRDLLNIPLGEMVRSVAMAIADAQFQLDQSSIAMATMMSGQGGVLVAFGQQQLSMMELGFVPNFYQFVDTVIEMKIALRVSRGPEGNTVLTSTPVDATYASAYSYNMELACVFKTKLVPIPPPAAFEERLSALLQPPQ